MNPKTALGAVLLAANALTMPSCSEQQKQTVKDFFKTKTSVYIDQPDKDHVDVTTYHPYTDLHITLADSSVQEKNSVTGHMTAPTPYKVLDGFEKNIVNMGVTHTKKTPYIKPEVIDLGQELTGLFHAVHPTQKSAPPKAK